MWCLKYFTPVQLLTRRPSSFYRRGVVICVILLMVYALFHLIPRRWRHGLASIEDRTLLPLPSFIIRAASNNQSAGGHHKMHSIPKIIHQTWKSKDGIPETFKPWMESWIRKNRDWDYWFWTDEDMRTFVVRVFPEFLYIYDSYPSQFYRADAFRYFLLYAVGGVYADLDMECLKPFDDIAQRDNCVISQEPFEHPHFLNNLQPPLVSNALMACQPNHPFFEYVINHLKSYTGFFSWNDILHATGPFMLTEVFKKYHSHSVLGNKEDTDSVRLASPDEFQPHPDDSMIDHMRQKCRSDQKGLFSSESFTQLHKTLCQKVFRHDFGRNINPASFSNHHWTHTWAGKYHDPWGVSDMRIRFPVNDLLLIHRQ